jgi:hypothetical protein
MGMRIGTTTCLVWPLKIKVKEPVNFAGSLLLLQKWVGLYGVPPALLTRSGRCAGEVENFG